MDQPSDGEYPEIADEEDGEGEDINLKNSKRDDDCNSAPPLSPPDIVENEANTEDDPVMELTTEADETNPSLTSPLHLIEEVTRKTIAEIVNRPSYDVRRLPQDTYSLFVTSKVFHLPFLVASYVVIIQYSCFSLLLLDMTNPLDIPVNVETPVRIAQVILLLLAVLSQGDLAVAVDEIVRGYVHEEMDTLFEYSSRSKWLFAMLMKCLEGLAGLVSVFLLIMVQSDVYELLLTFAGVEFVYHMDDVAFFLCKSNYFGEQIYIAVCDIEEKSWVSSRGKRGTNHLKSFGILLSGIAIFSGFVVISNHQRSSQFLCKHLQVEMSDEQLASLGPLNGFYDLVPSLKNDDRVTYEQQGAFSSEEARGKFAFCNSDDVKGWTLSTISNEASGSFCDNWFIRSSETSTFDLEETRAMPWQFQSGRQLEFIRLSCYDNDGSFVKENGYEAGIKEMEVGFEGVCRYIVLDSSTTGFRDISLPNFSFLGSENYPFATLQVYQHYVYINDNHDYVMVFLGVRWVLGTTKQLLSLLQNDDGASVSSVLENGGIDWLRNGGWIKYISEPVDSNVDTGTPLGLQWYHSSNPSSGDLFPGPDLDQRMNVILRCGVCNSKTNPCFNEGQCSEEGNCSCLHGASGDFCEIPPVGDGVCQDYFNTEDYEWDGGDCCASTCHGIECGVSTVNNLFGYDLDFPIKGFPNCKDPSMIPVTIVLNMTTMPVYGDVSFYSTWEVYCDGIEYLYSPRLGYKEFLSTDVFGNQTIFVEPRASCQVIARTKFYFEYARIDIHRDSIKHTSVMTQEYEILLEDIDFEFPVLSRCLLDELSTVSAENDVLDSTSIQGQAAAWIDVEASDLSQCGTKFLIQLYALATINFSLDETPKENVQWLSSTNGCKWSGIFCDSTGSISVIFLAYENLKGRLPSEISLLADLEIINLSLNDIVGTLPSELGILRHLSDLSLSDNELSGTIPIELGNLLSLKALDLSWNSLNGTIPTLIGNLLQLTAFQVEENDLSGTIPTPIGNLLQLTFFSVAANDLSGTIPTQIGNLLQLTHLSVAANDLSGTIPTAVGNLHNLTRLFFYNNSLTGFVPREVTSIGGIIVLDIKGTNLTCHEDDLLCMSLAGDN